MARWYAPWRPLGRAHSATPPAVLLCESQRVHAPVVSATPGDRVLPGAYGAEVGLRHGWRRGTVALAAWVLDLQSELVYVGDEGVTEPSGRSRRMGLDAELRVQLLPWLWGDADLNLSRGRFKDEPTGADFAPLAPTITSTGGLTLYGDRKSVV